MVVEKIKQHGYKILFFGINILLVALGAMYLKQKNLEALVASSAASSASSGSQQSSVDYAKQAQDALAAERDAKLKNIAENSGTVTQEKVTPVTKTIPAVTKKVTTQKPVNSASSSTSSSKTTTKTS